MCSYLKAIIIITSLTRLDVSLSSPGLQHWCRSPSLYRDPVEGCMEPVRTKGAARRSPNPSMINEANAELQNYAAEVVSLHSLINRLTTTTNELEAVNSEIEPLIPVKALLLKLSTTLAYEKVAVHTLSFLRDRFHRLTRKTTAPTTSTPSGSVRTLLQHHSLRPRLSKLDITSRKLQQMDVILGTALRCHSQQL